MSVEPTAFTASQIETQVRELLADNINFVTTTPDGQDPQTWSTQQVYDAINFAIKEYCKSTRASFREIEVDVDTDGSALIPQSYIGIDHVIYPARPIGSKPKYIRVTNMAAAWDTSSIYLIKDGAVWVWDANTDYEYRLCSLPTYSGWIYDIQISSSNIIFLTQKWIYASYNDGYTVYYGQSIQTARYIMPLDGSSPWLMDDQWGWCEYWGPGYNDLYRTVALTLGAGKTLYLGDVQWHENPDAEHQRSSRDYVSGDPSSGYYDFRAINGIYYSTYDRTLLGVGWRSPIERNVIIDVSKQSQISLAANKTGGNKTYINIINGNKYIYWSDVNGLHAGLGVYTWHTGGYDWDIVDHVYPGKSLASMAPIPFQDRSLIILSDGSGLWWDGTNFTPDDLSTAGSAFDFVRYAGATMNATTGRAVMLNDGSVLHVG